MMRSFLRSGLSRPGFLLQSRWPLKVDRPAARGTANIARAVQLTEHSIYIEEVAVAQSPKRLGALIKALVAQGGKALLPSDRTGLHPLLIPLVCETADSERVTCLLRWPKPTMFKGMSQPVVSMARGGKCMTLVARSVDEYLHRLLAQEDEAGPGPKPVADAAGEAGLSLYQPGDIAAAGLPGKTHMYIIKKIGMFPDVNETLAKGHLAKGDVTSALVASEWYMRNNHYPGWARPYEFAAELLTGLSRAEEARDMARVSLQLPWWTLEGGYEAARDMAQLQGTPAEVRYNLSDEASAAAQAKLSQGISFKETRSAQEVSLDKAAGLLDMVVAGVEPSYESVRERLIEAYKGAGLNDVANFILSAS